MSILSRFGDIVSANFNALLDKCEDPSKMVDEYIRKATEDLAEVKKETSAIMATEAQAKRAYEENQNNIDKYVKLAEKAVMAGNDGDAKIFIAKKQEFETNGASLKQAYDVAHANSEKMKQMHDKLTEDINSLKARRNNVKSQMAVAKTQEKINNIQKSSDKVTSSMGAFARMEEKAQHRMDEAMAMAELNAEPVDEAKSAEAKYTGVNASSVDDELAALKAKLNQDNK